jgi:hypothetical protein
MAADILARNGGGDLMVVSPTWAAWCAPARWPSG